MKFEQNMKIGGDGLSASWLSSFSLLFLVLTMITSCRDNDEYASKKNIRHWNNWILSSCKNCWIQA